MRFEKGHKENTRRRIIDVASRRFRKDGISASGLAGIMAESGLTNGAFYPHFDSKETLVREAVSSALSDQAARLANGGEAAAGIEGAIRDYLSMSHLQGCEEGCPSAALLPEIGRQPAPTRQAYQDGLLAYVAQLATLLPKPKSAQARRRATAIFGLMVGTLQLARAVADPALAEQILEEGVQAALSLAKA
ncbi:TetR/AcrR family transcriptional regulator [Bordetella bronchialis]|uniref:TetR family transcriptional regulator n=1 Tax=Bordetella bronchialis TaxID=463025 RepID=A0A193FY02_9BORD|nr:TetR family transcriptional regulator [Bordetella bronchialis]ANN72243.1 TetR family transcriptional regulator [Bordetella bronchialis]